MQEDETAPQFRLLREIFNGGCPPKDLPKTNFMLDSDDVDEEQTEVPVATFLNISTRSPVLSKPE